MPYRFNFHALYIKKTQKVKYLKKGMTIPYQPTMLFFDSKNQCPPAYYTSFKKLHA